MTNTQRNKILVADDEEYIRNLIFRILVRAIPNFEADGFEVELFPDGTSLEARLNKGIGNVGLVITDNDMPGVSGGELIKKYALRPEFSRIPFILQYGGPSDTGMTAIENGAFTYITKPSSAVQTSRIIKGALDYSSEVTASSQ